MTPTATLLPAQVPEDEAQALSDDITVQLGRLPTVIVDDASYRRVKESLPELKRVEDKVVGFFREIKEAAHRAHKAITTKEADQLKPIRSARQQLSNLIYGYEREQERQRRERERVLRQEEQARRDEAALADAEALSAQGAPEMAAQVIEEAAAAPAPVVVTPTREVAVAGVSRRENWQPVYMGASPGQKWRDLTDEERKRVLPLLPREFLVPDESAIGKVVKAMKSGTQIPGIQPYDVGTLAVRG